MVCETTRRPRPSITRSMRPKAIPLEKDCTMGMPFTSCAIPAWVWPATIPSTVPGASARATSTISCAGSHEERSFGSSNFEQRPPAWAVTSTRWAPRLRSAAACFWIVSTSGAISSPSKLRALVVRGVSMVARPMTPILTPARSISTDGWRLGQLAGSRAKPSIRLAARNGNDASAERAFSAPRGSSRGSIGTARSPTGPKSYSWLPTATAA